MNYMEYANLGSYLFNTVRKRFATQGYLNAFDFFSIVIWKSNRSKSKVFKMITDDGKDTVEDVVKYITEMVSQAATPKEKLRILRKCNFRMPMASAILTVLYPEEFTIYDYRVRQALGIPKLNFPSKNFELVWARYQEFKAKVDNSTPSGLTLREKDLYLWGKSRSDQLVEDIKNGFPQRKKDEEEEDEE